jgi:hypothetical protein
MFLLYGTDADQWNIRYLSSFAMSSIMDTCMMFKIVNCNHSRKFLPKLRCCGTIKALSCTRYGFRSNLLLASSPPNGSDFASPGLEPCQSIKRTLNPNWDPRNPSSASKFLLNPFWHDSVRYWSLFDILGLFLSVVGVAPSSATTRNFYPALTAMYAKWCGVLGASVPTMFNCTWIASGPGRGTFFLGASLKGYHHSQPSTGPWGMVVKEARFSLINDAAIVRSGYTMTDCPMKREHGMDILFGNCAEVYPFIHLLQ